ncbi:MAG: hypothetical protein WD491_09435, partial [Balneolales bacterium]
EVKEAKEQERTDVIKDIGPVEHDIQNTHFDGPDLNRPVWLNDEEILYYGSFYNKRPGFWKLNVADGDQTMVLETNLVEDYWYDVSKDKKHILYSRYRPHPYYGNTNLMDLYEFNFESSDSRRLTDRERLHAPVYANDGIWALQTHHETSKWVGVDSDGTTDSLMAIRPDNLVEIRPRPHGNEIAVVANRNGVQGLWFVELGTREIVLEEAPSISIAGASIFDATWSSDGSKLLFSADYGGVMNVFEYDAADHRVVQVTNSLYNAFEGSYSPDRNRIAYIVQDGDYRKLAVKDRKDFLGREISREVWGGGEEGFIDHPRLAEYLDEEAEQWESGPYSAGLSWLRPRGILPVYEEASGPMGHRFGVSLLSGDVLRRHSYLASISSSNRRLWYDASYRYSGFFPGFRLNAYNTPGATTDFLLEERGAGIEIPISITTENNTRFSGFSAVPGLRLEEARVITSSGSALSEWEQATTASLNTSYNHRIQQNIRDAQPNTGAVVYALNEIRRFSDASFTQALRAGMSVYASPLRRYNQSLRLGGDVLVQGQPGIRTAGFASEGFSDNVLAGLNNAFSLNARYTVPLWNPGRAWLLFPLQVDRFYAVAFSNMVGSISENSFEDLYSRSRSVYGLGLRMGFGLFNARFDIGVAFGYEPTRGTVNPFIGAF